MCSRCRQRDPAITLRGFRVRAARTAQTSCARQQYWDPGCGSKAGRVGSCLSGGPREAGLQQHVVILVRNACLPQLERRKYAAILVRGRTVADAVARAVGVVAGEEEPVAAVAAVCAAAHAALVAATAGGGALRGVSNSMWSSWYETRACLNSSSIITSGNPGTK